MKLQTDAQIPDSIDNLGQRLLTSSLPSFEANPPPDCAKREDKNVNAPHQTHTGDGVTETGAQEQLRSLQEPGLTGQPPRAVKCCVGWDLT